MKRRSKRPRRARSRTRKFTMLAWLRERMQNFLTLKRREKMGIRRGEEVEVAEVGMAIKEKGEEEEDRI